MSDNLLDLRPKSSIYILNLAMQSIFSKFGDNSLSSFFMVDKNIEIGFLFI